MNKINTFDQSNLQIYNRRLYIYLLNKMLPFLYFIYTNILKSQRAFKIFGTHIVISQKLDGNINNNNNVYTRKYHR